MKAIKNVLRFSVIVIALLCNTQLQAQELSNTNLWKVEGEGIQTSYIFGTIHILPQEQFKLKEKVIKAFEATEGVALEIDMLDPNFAKDVMSFSYLKEKDEIKNYMSEEEYKLLDDYLKEKTGTGILAYNTAKPFMLMSAVLTSSMGKQFASYEMKLMEMTRKANKELDGMESFESQINIFDDQPYDEQIDGIIEMIEKPEESSKIFETMVKLYVSENISEMYDYTDEFLKVDEKIKRKLLDDRNKNWIPKIKEYSKSKSMFYAVGAGHLAGKNGVINLLKKQGYKVTPVLD